MPHVYSSSLKYQMDVAMTKTLKEPASCLLNGESLLIPQSSKLVRKYMNKKLNKSTKRHFSYFVFLSSFCFLMKLRLKYQCSNINSVQINNRLMSNHPPLCTFSSPTAIGPHRTFVHFLPLDTKRTYFLSCKHSIPVIGHSSEENVCKCENIPPLLTI